MYLTVVLWAYRYTPHSSVGEKPSFLLFGFDCRHPSLYAIKISNYYEELVLNLSSARVLAAKFIAKAQQALRDQYNRHTNATKLKVGLAQVHQSRANKCPPSSPHDFYWNGGDEAIN